jgi:hypothetical protein
MASKKPLSDEDRWDWLITLRANAVERLRDTPIAIERWWAKGLSKSQVVMIQAHQLFREILQALQDAPTPQHATPDSCSHCLRGATYVVGPWSHSQPPSTVFSPQRRSQCSTAPLE